MYDRLRRKARRYMQGARRAKANGDMPMAARLYRVAALSYRAGRWPIAAAYADRRAGDAEARA